ncbi:hypothetical protein HK097_007027 [Rhizophlyctis rosea]|uniref:Uncharacterized protein n=1 Tax=Rhizophlyctis rosea TaxID=64517 RepID=A0AAD5SLM7_9FUNG|nr:hypothetical protein HK097_007027 [Rhizophlyctis rosea]
MSSSATEDSYSSGSESDTESDSGSDSESESEKPTARKPLGLALRPGRWADGQEHRTASILQEALEGVKQPFLLFFVSGSMNSEPFHLFFLNPENKSAHLSFPVDDMQASSHKRSVTKLLKSMEEACFGFGSKTVVDHHVRKALALDPRKLATTINVVPEQLLEHMHRNLKLKVGGVEAELYKLNIYVAALKYAELPKN